MIRKGSHYSKLKRDQESISQAAGEPGPLGLPKLQYWKKFMKTVRDNIQDLSSELKDMFRMFLNEYSDIYLWNKPNSSFSLVISTSRDYAWKDLSEDGRKYQSQLHSKFKVYHSILQTLLSDQPSDTLSEFEEAIYFLSEVIEQTNYTWFDNTDEALDKCLQTLENLTSLIDRVYASEEEVLFIPDTNALLFNPKLEKWAFENVPQFTLVLTSTILSELDSLKVNHNNPDVREKSEKLIRQIKEYRRRGNLLEGVPIVRNQIYLRSSANEPNMDDTLPWLDPDNNDDRFLALILEIMRGNLRSKVLAVTRDINLQNKLDYSGIPYVEPPK